MERSMHNPVFLIITASPDPAQEVARTEYLQQAQPVSAKHGAIQVASYQLNESLDGGSMPAVCVIVSFPSRAAIHDLFADPDYQRLIAHRDLGFTSIRYFIGSEQVT